MSNRTGTVYGTKQVIEFCKEYLVFLKQLGTGACLHGCGGPQVGQVTRLAVIAKQLAFTYNLTTSGCRAEVFESLWLWHFTQSEM